MPYYRLSKAVSEEDWRVVLVVIQEVKVVVDEVVSSRFYVKVRMALLVCSCRIFQFRV